MAASIYAIREGVLHNMTQSGSGRKKCLLVACSGGIATSHIVYAAIDEALKKAGLDVEVRGCKVSELTQGLEGVDIVVTTARYKGSPISKPLISAMPILSGIGVDKWKADLIKMIQDLP